jgi:microcystin-dependent protein
VAAAGYTEFFSDGAGCVGNFGRTSSGIITIWSGSVGTIPTGWLLCDGTNGTIDLRDKFIIGAGSTYVVGDTGGSATVTLTNAQMPSHLHTVAGTTAADGIHTHGISDPSHAHSTSLVVNGGGASSGGPSTAGTNTAIATNTGASGTGISIVAGGAHQHSLSGTTGSIGGGGSHENRPPYYALCFIEKA